MRQVVRLVLLVVSIASVTLHGGPRVDRRASNTELISFLNLGNPTLTEYDCSNVPFVVWQGTDVKSYPAVGGYACPTGPVGNLTVSSNPLVASGHLACMAYIRTCPPIFGSPGSATYFSGGVISHIGRYVEMTERQPSTSGCDVSGTTATFETTVTAVFDNDDQCHVEPDCSACSNQADGPEECAEGAGYNEECGCCVQDWSPIVIDTAGDGFRLTNRIDGVMFDINGDGSREQLPWTSLGSNDAWLALDRNGDGLINSGRELFGNFTEQPPSGDKNGFLALALFDRPEAGGNGNGTLDPADAVFSQLRLWKDHNHDGVSQPPELATLAETNISSISLNYKEAKWVDQFGNWYRYRTRVFDAHARDIGKWAYDVYLGGAPPGTNKIGR